MTQITVQDGKIVLRDGKVGTGAGCCCGGDCECDLIALHGSSKSIMATVTVTLPDVPGDCPSGEYTVNLELTTLSSADIFGCQNFEIGPICYVDPFTQENICYYLTAAVSLRLKCEGGQYRSYAAFSTIPCAGGGYACTIGSGGYVGFEATQPEESAIHESRVLDGVCVPSEASSTLTREEVPGCVLTWTLWAE